MRLGVVRKLGLALWTATFLSPIAHAAESVSVPLTGLQIRHNTNQTRTSAPATIDPANNYTVAYSEDTRVRGVGGILGILFPNPVTLDQVVQTFDPDADFPDSAQAPNPSGTHPATLVSETIDRSATVLGATITFRATLTSRIDAAGVAIFEITGVTLTSSNPFLQPGYLQFTAGTSTVTRNPVPVCDDIDFNGDGVFPDNDDIVAFLCAFSGCNTCPTCNDIDFNNDSVFPDSADIEAFLRVFSGGAC